MVAKAAGVLFGALITVVWFWMIGTQPVLETVVGLLLGLGAGAAAYYFIDRKLGQDGSDR